MVLEALVMPQPSHDQPGKHGILALPTPAVSPTAPVQPQSFPNLRSTARCSAAPPQSTSGVPIPNQCILTPDRLATTENKEDGCSIYEDILRLGYYGTNNNTKHKPCCEEDNFSIFEKLGAMVNFKPSRRRGTEPQDLDSNNNDFYCVDENIQVQRKRSFFRNRNYFTNALATKFFIVLLLGFMASITLPASSAVSLPPRAPTFYLRTIPTRPTISYTSSLATTSTRRQDGRPRTRSPRMMSSSPTLVPSSVGPSSTSSLPSEAKFDFLNNIHPNDTLTAEEFGDILRSFQLDALRATQLADEYGLLEDGAREHLEELVRADAQLHGPGGDLDKPMALPLTGVARHRDGPMFRRGSPRPGGTDTIDRRDYDSDIDRDPNMCYSGSCEFFLMCWVSGGLIEEGCGGFLYACCNRPGRAHYPGSFSQPPFRDDPRGLIPMEHGPVRNDPACGLTDTSRIGAQRRVVGGTEAGFGSFPWQAYIRIGSSRCGGSLINKFHVVTAGHCVARARASQIRVTLGDYILNSDQEPLPARVYRASDIKVHPRFKFTPQADRYDVAVIRLEVPVHYEPHIQPICLPEKGTDFLGHFGWAAGWGALQAGSRQRPKTLQVVDVPVIDSQLCESWHRQKGINVIIHEEMMCAGYTNGGKDSCQGDSGGPLNMQIHGRWYLAGIVSAGYSCARDRQPGIYHRVAYTSDWISWAAS
ncbi:uncharacterized protein LOC108674083 isoform X2 [Hyalella azteca]|uniref:Uncharacterized protein LOC108674083 isoform X2 n=1 Tax=Hyalella azteca TaxID=294128 RepID=A0A8B7NUT7_HYAAZ|nr:uncharacterized protein LOC108674083 isoform X2 [Hyalella azteca]